MTASGSSAVILLVLLAGSVGTEASQVNPVRKVVNLLMGMQSTITAEGEKEKELFDKFMCYCQTGSADLTKKYRRSKREDFFASEGN